MRTIAIDTSHAAGSVAAQAGEARAQRSLGPSGQHARLLAAAIAEVAADLGWKPADAELIAVVRGPGSFTGLRVGVATAKAIAWAGPAKLLGVSGFECVAAETARLAGWQKSPVVIAFDAGRGEVLAATATPTIAGDSWRIEPGELVDADRWIATLPPASHLSGPALTTLADRLAAAGHHLAPEAAWFPTADAALALAIPRARAGSADTPESLVPDYLRPSYADERAGGPPGTLTAPTP
jgi:tRNA threonylcarbamoyladenosine biosynthesis protein TsaB